MIGTSSVWYPSKYVHSCFEETSNSASEALPWSWRCLRICSPNKSHSSPLANVPCRSPAWSASTFTIALTFALVLVLAIIFEFVLIFTHPVTLTHTPRSITNWFFSRFDDGTVRLRRLTNVRGLCITGTGVGEKPSLASRVVLFARPLCCWTLLILLRALLV